MMLSEKGGRANKVKVQKSSSQPEREAGTKAWLGDQVRPLRSNEKPVGRAGCVGVAVPQLGCSGL